MAPKRARELPGDNETATSKRPAESSPPPVAGRAIDEGVADGELEFLGLPAGKQRDVSTRDPSLVWTIQLLQHIGRALYPIDGGGCLFGQSGVLEIVAGYMDGGVPRFAPLPAKLTTVRGYDDDGIRSDTSVARLVTMLDVGNVGWFQRSFPVGHAYGYFVVVWKRGWMVGIVFPRWPNGAPQLPRMKRDEHGRPLDDDGASNLREFENPQTGGDLLESQDVEKLAIRVETELRKCRCGVMKTRLFLDRHLAGCPVAKAYATACRRLDTAMPELDRPPQHGFYRVHYLNLPMFTQAPPQETLPGRFQKPRRGGWCKGRWQAESSLQKVTLTSGSTSHGVAVTHQGRQHAVVFALRRSLVSWYEWYTPRYYYHPRTHSAHQCHDTRNRKRWLEYRQDLVHSLPQLLSSVPFSVTIDHVESITTPAPTPIPTL